MEKIKVHTFHSNGNDVICKSINAERVNEHILYISENQEYGSWSKTYYYLIVGYNGIYVKLDMISNLHNITNLTFDKVVEVLNNRVENKLYFNKVELVLCKAISSELYEKALLSRDYVLKQRAREECEREEKRKIELEKEKVQKEEEKARKLKEKEEKKAKDEQFFRENSDILKSDLSSFEKLTAKNELNKLYRWNFYDTKTTITCSILDLIRKHNYCKINSATEEYSRNGDLLKVPRTYYSIRTAEDELGFQIPAKLGKIMILTKE